MVSASVILIGVFIFLIVVVPIAIYAFVWFTSFKFKAWIAIQTGKDATDVIWIEDKFKVVDKAGKHEIVFRWQRDKSQSFDFKNWTKVINKKIAYNDQEWALMRKHLRRGLFLYRTTEGEYHPMQPIVTPNDRRAFRILPQDNRAFLIDQFEHVNNLVLTPRKQFLALGMVIAAIVVLGFTFVLFLVYITESYGKICSVAGNTFLETAQGVVGG